ncbi:IS30 family transposase, partial [Lactobacillus murinus]|uniref:transposase n=1 Tax=Ligilactobacillus murinus TaxID=1622 RepID=UPI0019F0C017|nr:IS30 family transposase [Ligilactobacillus murinus]
MTYNHLTISELSFIQNFWNQGVKAYIVAKTLKRSAETIYRVFRFLDAGNSISEYYENYRTNKAKSERKPIVLPNDELEYIKEKVSLGWTPDTIIGRNEKHISCSMRTLYRIFKRSNVLDVTSLPMKGKRHPNGYVERRGKAGRLGRALLERHQDYPNYHNEFGHLEA